jgi:hypothetical protein
VGFYVRKSVKAGPFRFNLSGSGVGVSTGVPGFRVGTGPRGNYVSVGRNGFYYRSAIGSSASPSPAVRSLPEQTSVSQVLMEDVTGATAYTLEPTGPGDVVEQLNAAAQRRGVGWPVAVVAVLLGLFTLPWGLAVWLLAVPACWWLFQRDAARRTVVLFYDVNDAHETWFSNLVDGWAWLSGSQGLWREIQSGNVQTIYQHKTNAGASSLVQRVKAAASLTGPKHLATNVAVPTIIAGDSSLHFLPDRLLVREGRKYSDVAYLHLQVNGYQQRFIESASGYPRDANQVGQTWQYVNVKGGPDRRYNNNPALPIMLYGGIDLRTAHGLNWVIQVSREDAAANTAALLSSVPSRSVER